MDTILQIVVILLTVLLAVLITLLVFGVEGDSLQQFKLYYVQSLPRYFAMKAEKVANPTRAWNDDTMFEGLNTWTDAAQFGTACHTIIGYCVRYISPDDPLFRDITLAERLLWSLLQIDEHLPYDPPVNEAPWGPPADWYHFTITMPEVFMTVSCVLHGTEYEPVAELVTESVLARYLPTATHSLGWVRTAGNAMRMGIPYVFSQLLRGLSLSDIRLEPEVQHVLEVVSFPYVVSGNGLWPDAIYIDHIDVRAYGYLINSYFTFDYYIYFFGPNTVNKTGLRQSILNVSCPEGIVNPACMSRQGVAYSNVIGNFEEYTLGIKVANVCKVLTSLTPDYFGSVVGYTNDLAYYEADPTNNQHAQLWAMCKRLWNRRGTIVPYTPSTLIYESGVLLDGTSGIVVPSTTTSTQSFRPINSFTHVVGTRNLGAMRAEATFPQLRNLSFVSYTVFHPTGMLQYYQNIHMPQSGTANARLVVMARYANVTPTNTYGNESGNDMVYNGIRIRRMDVLQETPNLPNITIRNVVSTAPRMDVVEQVISAASVVAGDGRGGYKFTVPTDATDDVTCTRSFDHPTFGNTYMVANFTHSSSAGVVFFDKAVAIRDDRIVSVDYGDGTTLPVAAYTHVCISFRLDSMTPTNSKYVNESFVKDTLYTPFDFIV